MQKAPHLQNMAGYTVCTVTAGSVLENSWKMIQLTTGFLPTREIDSVTPPTCNQAAQGSHCDVWLILLVLSMLFCLFYFHFQLVPTQTTAAKQSFFFFFLKVIESFHTMARNTRESQMTYFGPNMCVSVCVCVLQGYYPSNKPGVEPRRPCRPVNITPLLHLSNVSNRVTITWGNFGKVRVSHTRTRGHRQGTHPDQHHRAHTSHSHSHTSRAVFVFFSFPSIKEKKENLSSSFWQIPQHMGAS